MTTAAHKSAAERFRRVAHDHDIAANLAQERHDTASAAEHLDEAQFWADVAAHHEHTADVRARTLLDA